MTEDVQEVEAVEAAEPVEPVEAPEASEPPKPQYDPQDIEEARLFGWKAPDEWVGEKPESYTDDPTEFLSRVQKSRIFRAMEAKLEQQHRTAEETARRLEAMNDAALKRQKEQYEARMRSLGAQARRAAEEGDLAAYDALERERSELMARPPQEAPKAQEPPPPDPRVVEYREKHEWTKNPILWREAAEAVQYALDRKEISTDPGVQIEYAENIMRQKYPHLFPVAEKPKPAPQKVDAGGLAGGQRSSAFSKLPASAKEQFRRFVDQGIYSDTKKDQEEYANEYANS